MPKLDPADNNPITNIESAISASILTNGDTFQQSFNQQLRTDTATNALGQVLAAQAANPAPEEHWIKTYWRPATAWFYLMTCFCDFLLFPILWSWLQMNHGGTIQQPWSPLTLQGGGLFHVAMGAIIGVTAYGRSKEKTA